MNYFSFYKGGKVLYCLFFMGLVLSFSSSLARNYSRSFSLFFQHHKVQGVITDGITPLPGVTISVKGRTDTAAITDYSGNYVISASANDTLTVSFIGFKTKHIPVSGRSRIDIVLQFDITTLQEVRVNAGYYSVKESERTGSIARITSKDIENQPVTNVLATMQGRMAGVSISQDSGLPGGNFNIQIRGQNSLRSDGNAPLYVINGTPFSSEPIGSSQTSTFSPGLTSPLNSINPDDIESIEVLKDADATAIYGSRGANGVVLITTKKGKEGKTRFSINYSGGIGKVTKRLDLMKTPQYLQMRREAYNNDGFSMPPASAYDVNGVWNQNRNTDWQEVLIGGAADITNLQTTLSGGSSQTQFLLSGNYHKEGTVFPGDFVYNKGNFNFNINHSSNDKKFKINFNTAYTSQKNDQPWSDLTREAMTLAPNAPPLYDSDGNLNWSNGTFENPLRNFEAKFITKTGSLLANAFLSYEIMEGFELKSNFGFNDLNHAETRTFPSTIYNPSFNIGPASSALFLNNTQRQSWIIEPQINWKSRLNNFSLEVILGGTFQNQTTDKLVQRGLGFTSNNLIYDLASATSKIIYSNEEILYKYQAFFGRVNLNWKERYILNLTARRDGSSRFSPENQYANFGAVGFAWLFHKEPAFSNLFSFISFGKLRSSYGTTGSDQIGDYQFLNTYSSVSTNYQGLTGLQPSRLYNPNFGWEINKKFETALELGTLQDRIFLTAAYYQNRSSNQLVGIPLPGTTGFVSIQSNLDAVVQNSGFELTLRTENIKKDKLGWITNFNITVPRNKLISFPGLAGSTYANQYVIGQPLNIQKVYKYKNVNPQSGIYDFEDFNNDGIISAPADRSIVKNLSPKFFAGLQNQLNYKNFQLDFLFQLVEQDNWNWSNSQGVPGAGPNQAAALGNQWQKIGDISTYQKFTTGTNAQALDAYYKYSLSDAAISDASYIRLKNVSISYNLPNRFAGSMQLKIFMEAQNLLTFTKYQGADPEFKFTGYLPPLKVITTGIQLNF
ncbi:SusC/RagA family TonB-linked outer membrane protein [Flavobacterium flavigenum]|uniref:SusC/RagA family TonB-linked outer membrane protein n=1 Tax=Flavobacterium flavigenum TaxID=3003258 RepID=UPI00248293C9|nr:SusC/RagA family TonB-linked outer membrane protein [Flavobacterium flavigenum]